MPRFFESVRPASSTPAGDSTQRTTTTAPTDAERPPLVENTDRTTSAVGHDRAVDADRRTAVREEPTARTGTLVAERPTDTYADRTREVRPAAGSAGTVAPDRDVKPTRVPDTGLVPPVTSRKPVDTTPDTVTRPTDGTPVDADRTPTSTDPTAEPTAVPVPVGPRPRQSLLATLGLVTGVTGALFVLTGALAGYGIALGALATVLSVAGLSATRRRHVAGKADGMIGVVLGLAAVVAGIVAVTDVYDWPNMDTSAVERFREWLDSQFDRLF